ncbi:hypothetical protein JRQ81_003483 [Phrynocephalus forsythii]|uniref:Uncharacterized protein n=1 Tax=Phrynocephalus forsythii TaxID=171643 RepID=A0A9Q0XKP5_9SAUR|nr:hypothetical protein JRQ81_003483 [Phrynocephalus forsythii]
MKIWTSSTWTKSLGTFPVKTDICGHKEPLPAECHLNASKRCTSPKVVPASRWNGIPSDGSMTSQLKRPMTNDDHTTFSWVLSLFPTPHGCYEPQGRGLEGPLTPLTAWEVMLLGTASVELGLPSYGCLHPQTTPFNTPERRQPTDGPEQLGVWQPGSGRDAESLLGARPPGVSS